MSASLVSPCKVLGECRLFWQVSQKCLANVGKSCIFLWVRAKNANFWQVLALAKFARELPLLNWNTTLCRIYSSWLLKECFVISQIITHNKKLWIWQNNVYAYWDIASVWSLRNAEWWMELIQGRPCRVPYPGILPYQVINVQILDHFRKSFFLIIKMWTSKDKMAILKLWFSLLNISSNFAMKIWCPF